MGGYRKGVFIVIFRRNKGQKEYLVLERKLHWRGWEFPKGGLKKWEKGDEKKAVLRELREEAGKCKIVGIKKFNVSGRYKYDKRIPERPWKGQTYSLYAVEVKCARVKIDRKEHYSYKWLGFEEAYNILTWDNQKKCLKIVDKSIK